MKTIRSLEDLKQFREEIIEQKKQKASLGKTEVIVGLGTCSIGAGALDTLNAIRQQAAEHHLKDIVISETGCIGLCRHEPIVEIIMGDGSKTTYGKVTSDRVPRIFNEHILDGKVIDEFVIDTTPFPTI